MQVLLWTMLCLAAGPEVEVRTLDGQSLVGQVVELTAEKVVVDTTDGQQTVGADKLLSLGPKTKPAAASEKPSVWLEMIDGTVLSAKSYATVKGQAKVELLDGTSITVPTRDLLSVRLQALTEAADKEWQRILGVKNVDDVIVIRKGDGFDYHKGVLYDVDETTVTFGLDKEKIPVKRTRVLGLIYYHVERKLPGAVCAITAADESRWPAQKLSLADGLVEWTTPCGVTMKRPLESLANLDFSGGKVVYLSDVKADSTQWTPYFGTSQPLPAVNEFYAPRMDLSLSAKPLQLGGEKFAKGIALHSRTELVYRLPGKFSRFRAVAGIDDEVAPNGHVQLIIRGDDKVLLDTTVAGGEKPKPIDLDIGGVKRLTILVDFGEKLDVADHLDLVMARITK